MIDRKTDFLYIPRTCIRGRLLLDELRKGLGRRALSSCGMTHKIRPWKGFDYARLALLKEIDNSQVIGRDVDPSLMKIS